MKRSVTRLIVLGLVLLFCALGLGAARAQDGGGRDPAVEAELQARLAEHNPEAVPVFIAATEALDRGDVEAARQGFESVVALAPGFDAGYRRLALIELVLGEVDLSTKYARQAFQIEDNQANRLTLVSALVKGYEFSQFSNAIYLLNPVLAEDPDNPTANWLLLQIGLRTKDKDMIREGSANVARLMPENPSGHFYNGSMLAQDGRWEQAHAELLQAQALGMRAAAVQEVLDEYDLTAKVWVIRRMRTGGYILAGWLAGLAGLVGVGLLLSLLTLQTVRRSPADPNAGPGIGERLLRLVYRAVIGANVFYFYFSIPFLLLALLLIPALFAYRLYVVGDVHVGALFFVVFLPIAMLALAVFSLRSRPRDDDPGQPLSPERAPELWALACGVAQDLGARPVEAIYVAPGSELAIIERGGLFKRLRDGGQRCLVLGLGLLPNLTQGQLQALLAHEYGHFLPQGTAGGGLARRTQAAIQRMAFGLIGEGLDRWYNPGWLFLSVYGRLFGALSLGALRLQEALADRHAALACGVVDLIDGLHHSARQPALLAAQVRGQIQPGGPGWEPPKNLYTLPALPAGEAQAQLEREVAAALDRPPAPGDAHLSLKERIGRVQRLTGARLSRGSSRPAWDLIPNMSELQEALTPLLHKESWWRLPVAK